MIQQLPMTFILQCWWQAGLAERILTPSLYREDKSRLNNIQSERSSITEANLVVAVFLLCLNLAPRLAVSGMPGGTTTLKPSDFEWEVS